MKKKLLFILSVFMLTYVISDFFTKEKSAFSESGEELILGGQIVGIKLYSEGIMVVGFEETEENPAIRAGIKTGDTIISANGIKINGTESFANVVSSSPDGVSVTYRRGGKEASTVIVPEKTADGRLMVGLWVRDSVGGVGTVTFYSEKCNKMVTLGHSVTDSDTGESFYAGGGVITDCEIASVEKSVSGSPGEIYGQFKADETVFGVIEKNTPCGLYASLCTMPSECVRVKTAPSGKVYDGGALLYSDIGGDGVKAYSVRLKKLYHADSKDFEIEITDERLLALTGGIVQGMSGSPVVQGGKLIGAVTHVFVNSPKKGYGIFVDNMLAETEQG